MKEVNWLLEQRPMVVDVKVRDKVFHMVEPTVQDRDKLDAVLSKMDLDTLEIRHVRNSDATTPGNVVQ